MNLIIYSKTENKSFVTNLNILNNKHYILQKKDKNKKKKGKKP